MTLPLLLYRSIAAMLAPFLPLHLRKRAARGKEDPARMMEKLGHSGIARPEGPLMWLHAASVGESLSVLELVRRILEARPSLSILVTTGTVTSAHLMAERLPPGAFHQYAPLDTRGTLHRFLDHWSPDLVAWTESEFWPNTLSALSRRKIPVVLVNGRMSSRSMARWRWMPLTAWLVLRRFRLLLVQDRTTARRLRRLGAARTRLMVTGSLKEGAAPLPHDETALRRLRSTLSGRPVWCAASTHPGEEETIASAHRVALRSNPGLILILVPRHPERGAEIADALRAEGYKLAQRSAGEPIAPDTEIYLADTLGELGLWYRLAPVSFVGGSLVPIGGHNPFEPAALGSAVATGPHTDSFAEAFARLDEAGGLVRVGSPDDLPEAITTLLRPDIAAAHAARGWDLVSDGAEATDIVLAKLLEHLPEHIS